MPKFVKLFLFSATFILGVSIGTYLGIEKEIKNTPQNANDIIPVQDVVIRNVQENKKEESKPYVVETIIEETKLSPYAKMVIEKKFTKCGHTTVDVTSIPKELINMTESEIIEKYSDWEIRSFTSNEVSLFREIDANCNDHFVLKEKDGYLAIYNCVTDDILNLKEVTDIDVSMLPSGDSENLKDGIYVYGQDVLNSLIEDFEI